MSETITSRQNARVKEAVKLRSARQRSKQGRFLIDGAREILRALDANIKPKEAFVCQALCTTADARRAVQRLSATAAVVSDVTPEVFKKLCFGERTDGVVVIAKTPRCGIDQLRLPTQPLLAVLAGLEKPGNVGAILRTADGAGVDAVIVVDGQTDLFNPNTIRASLGEVFSDGVCTATSAEAIAKVRELQLPIIVARPAAVDLYTNVDYRRGAAIVLGNEATGIAASWQLEDARAVRLPMQGLADSLNVSATAAVLFYEAQRQRAESPGVATPGL